MRADRLLSLLMLLQTRGRMTAERLAQELEVSVRTVYRDVYALRVAGFPVTSERGLGGGCYLHEDYRMRLTDLTQDEVAALFTLAVPTSLHDLGVGQQVKGALLKLAAALPAARRGVEQHVRNRILLDPQSWRSSTAPVPVLSLLREGVWADRWMRVTFRRMRSILTTREMAPYGLVAKATRWYVIWKGRDDEIHVDRASSMIQAELLDEGFERMESFDLPSYWSQWARRHEDNRPTFTATVCIREDALSQLIGEVGRERVLTLDQPSGEGLVHVDVLVEFFEQARSVVLGLGAAAEVVLPEALRRSVADFAAQTLAVYPDV